jgi:dihydroorotase
MTVSRRQWLGGAGTLAGFAFAPGLARAAMGPDDKFDLVVQGAEVLDPSQNLRARRDIGVRFGRIEALEETIPAERAHRLLSAEGNLVVPGLVDLHAHVFPFGSAIGIPADELVPDTCTTTAVSAGDAGANNFAAFRRYVAGPSRTRLYAFVHIANFGLAGFPVPEMLNIDHAQVEAAARTVAANRDMALGVKIRASANVVGDNGLEPVRRAIQAAELAGPWAKVMCHIGGVPETLTAILDMLRPGDIVTHCFSGLGNNVVQDGKVLPAALAAQERGVVFDIGHGGGSFDYTVAEPAMDQGLVPDTISSDIHVFSGNSPGMPYLPWVMSKFLNLGLSLEEVVTKATRRPAEVIDREPMLGTLQIGAPADLAIMELVEEPVSFVDTANNERQGDRWLRPVQTVRGGVPYGRPYMSPFSPT